MKKPAIDFIKTSIKTALVAAVIFSVAAPAAARTPLERQLQTRGYHLPNVIDYAELYETAYNEGIIDIEQMLADNKVQVLGNGDSRYVRASDLLRVCGKECNFDNGWGIFLSNFAVLKHRR